MFVLQVGTAAEQEPSLPNVPAGKGCFGAAVLPTPPAWVQSLQAAPRKRMGGKPVPPSALPTEGSRLGAERSRNPQQSGRWNSPGAAGPVRGAAALGSQIHHAPAWCDVPPALGWFPWEGRAG